MSSFENNLITQEASRVKLAEEVHSLAELGNFLMGNTGKYLESGWFKH
jgi:hypothetical protein